MKGKVRYVINVTEDTDISVNEMFEMLPVGSIATDGNGRKHEIKIPLVSHNGRHVIKKNIGHDYGSMYYDNLPVSKVIVSEFEWKIFLRKGIKDEQTGKHIGCTGRGAAKA